MRAHPCVSACVCVFVCVLKCEAEQLTRNRLDVCERVGACVSIIDEMYTFQKAVRDMSLCAILFSRPTMSPYSAATSTIFLRQPKGLLKW